MNIILLTNKGGQARNFDVNMARIGLGLVSGVIMLCAAAVYSGYRLGGDGLVYVTQWQDAVVQQQQQIAEARRSAQSDLDALALRIGQMQAQMLRLNALGERLVSEADLDRQEFDFDQLPAIGGPRSADALQSIRMPDFLATLDDLTVALEDREYKLTVLESLLMDKNLRARVVPSGRPIENGWLSSSFGKRTDPFSGKQEYHEGVDFAGKQGADVIAVGDGVVTWSGKRSGYGNLIEVNHGNGLVTRYGHNQKQLVAAGDTVKKGQLIALMGSTGRSTGPHVHFEVLRNGKPVNPARYLNN